jgi:glucan phosphoethanolaminetransferase (alkaline phosphatase superfamily)
VVLVLMLVPFGCLWWFRRFFSSPRSLSRIVLLIAMTLLPYPLKMAWNANSDMVWGNLEYPFYKFIPYQPYYALLDAIEYKQQLAAGNGGRVVPKIRRGMKAVPKTLVVVLGESLTRHRMGIYGYCRATTPWLTSEKDHLVLFNDIISSIPHTIPAVRSMLTSDTARYTIIDAFQEADIPVWWISNQPRAGIFESELSLLTESAVQHRWVNPNSGGNLMTIVPSYDNRVLPAFDEALATEGAKLIFVHLLGNSNPRLT